MEIIPYARHTIDNDDISEILKVFETDWLTQGPKVKEFEQALCCYTGAKYAVAVSNGTAALHLSMIALGVGKGDEIVTTPITFSASANCALYVGAKPRFVDINNVTYHIDIEKLESFLKVPSQRKHIKVVIPVHLMGTVVDVENIKNICDKYNIRVVEDAAHALGARYQCKGKWIKVGSCRHSDITILSFHPIKHITTGEGGAVLTNSKKIYEKVSRLRHHGIIKNKKPGFLYDIPIVGFNYRLTDFQSALGISQLKKVDQFVEKRRKIVKKYNQEFNDIKKVQLPYERENTYASYHLYVIRTLGNMRNRLYEYLKMHNILTQVNYIPVYLLSFYRRYMGYKYGDFPIAERYFRECLSLPLFPGLAQEQQDRVIGGLKKFLAS